MPSADWDFLWSIYVSNLKFLTLFVMKLRMAMQNEENGVVQGHQGSLKVISNIVAHSTESTQLPFLALIETTHLSCTIQETASYLLKIKSRPFSPTPLAFWCSS